MTVPAKVQVTANDFLSDLFGEKDAEHFLLLWRKGQKKESYWFKNIPANKQIEDIAKGADLYFGLGLSPNALGKHKRCLKDNVVAIPGLWADIDYGDQHKKANLPPTYDDALKFLNSLAFKPTYVVHSGNGFHGYWLFKELHSFNGETDRLSMQRLSQLWSTYLKSEGAKKGWEVDSVWDFARVLRVPGTYNNKKDPILCEIVQHNPDAFIDVESVKELVQGFDAEPLVVASQEENSEIDGVKLRADADIGTEKFESLSMNSDNFLATWQRKRKLQRDNSPSAYDMSLAMMACNAAWTDQEIVNLLIAHRRKHGDQLKLNRPDYYIGTVKKARKLTETSAAEMRIQNAAEETQTPDKKNDEKDRAAKLEDLSTMFGVKVHSILKFVTDPPKYRIVTARGAISLGEVDNIISPTKFRNRLASVTGHVLRPYKADRWVPIAQTMLDVCEDVDLGEESSDAGAARSWVHDYLRETKVSDDEGRAAIKGTPMFRRDEGIYISSTSLKKWLGFSQIANMAQKELLQALRVMGAEPRKVNVRVNGQPTSRNLWLLPRNEYRCYEPETKD